MMDITKHVGAGLALVLGLACGGARTDRPVVTRTDDGTTTAPAGQGTTGIEAITFDDSETGTKLTLGNAP